MTDNSELFQFLAGNASFLDTTPPYVLPPANSMQSFCSSSSYNYPMEGSEIMDTTQQDRALAALKNHKEAEKRRRERINSHLDKLRTLLPCNSKVLSIPFYF